MSGNAKHEPDPGVVEPKGILVTLPQLARIFGVSHPTIYNYIAWGCPVHVKGGRGKPYVLDTAKVIRWRERRTSRWR